MTTWGPSSSVESVPVDRPVVSIRDACAIVGVTRRTIYHWMLTGKVDYVRTAGGSVRIYRDSLWRAGSVAP